MEHRKNQRGQASLMGHLRNRTHFRPRGRRVDSRFRRRAIDSTQSSSPNGLPRCADSRTAANSASLNGVLTRSTQPGSREIGHGDSSDEFGSGFCSYRHNEPQRQSSARRTKPARSALRSTYRQTEKNGHHLESESSCSAVGTRALSRSYAIPPVW